MRINRYRQNRPRRASRACASPTPSSTDPTWEGSFCGGSAPGENPDATVMLIAMAGGGARGTWSSWPATKNRSLGDAAAAVCALPRVVRGVDASLASSTTITEVTSSWRPAAPGASHANATAKGQDDERRHRGPENNQWPVPRTPRMWAETA